MNILFVTLGHVSKMRGGIDRVTNMVSNALQDRGHNILLVSFWRPAESELLQANQFLFPSLVINDEINVTYINELVCKYNIDFIINQSDQIALLDLLLTVRTHVFLISVLHTDPKCLLKGLRDSWDKWRLNVNCLHWALCFPYYSARILYQSYNRSNHLVKKFSFFYEHNDAIVLLSNRFKKSFLQISHVDNDEKLFAISNPYSFTVEDSNSLCMKEKIVLFVGRLEFSPKRLDRLLKVWKYRSSDIDWQLIIIGDGPDRELFQRLCVKLKMTNVKFLGQADPIPYYKMSSILCLTSTFEGFGLVLTEALQYEVIPVVFESFESVHDIIESGYNGYLVKPFDLVQYYKVLKRLMEDEQHRKKMRQNIRLCTSKNTPFDIRKIVLEWENLLFSVIDKSKK